MRECKACGAPLKIDYWGRSRCEYCGTEYGDVNDRVTYVQHDNYYQPRQLQAEVRVDNYILRRDGKETKNFVMQELIKQFAERLPDYLTIEENYDIKRDRTTYRATLRVFQ